LRATDEERRRLFSPRQLAAVGYRKDLRLVLDCIRKGSVFPSVVDKVVGNKAAGNKAAEDRGEQTSNREPVVLEVEAGRL